MRDALPAVALAVTAVAPTAFPGVIQDVDLAGGRHALVSVAPIAGFLVRVERGIDVHGLAPSPRK